jgi:hypothetical protein
MNDRKHLQEALTIAQHHRKVMAGDYARVAHKLAQVLEASGENECEAVQRRSEAEAILAARTSIGKKKEDDDERFYDGLVYILWR